MDGGGAILFGLARLESLPLKPTRPAIQQPRPPWRPLEQISAQCEFADVLTKKKVSHRIECDGVDIIFDALVEQAGGRTPPRR